MSSVIFFRLSSATAGQMEPVYFTGHQLRLLDLKRAIVEQKKMSSSIDFDLKITDADIETKVYTGDDTFVPKNSSVVVKRVPAIGGGLGLLSRLRGDRQENASYSKRDNSIVVQSKEEAEPDESTEAPVVRPNDSETSEGRRDQQVAEVAPLPDVISLEEEEEMRALAALSERAGSSSGRDDTLRARPSTGGRVPGGRGGGRGYIPHAPPPPGYECRRCGKSGHYIQNCPTNNDLNFEKNKVVESAPLQKVLGVPTLSMMTVKDLEGVDTAGKLVKSTRDGFEILMPSNDGYNRLIKQGGSGKSISEIDMSQVPDELKCVYSHKLLRDAVRLPCCNKVVSDGAIREALFATSNFQCPLCRQVGITPDELRSEPHIRQAVEEYITASLAKAGSNDTTSNDVKRDMPQPPLDFAAPPPPLPPGPRPRQPAAADTLYAHPSVSAQPHVSDKNLPGIMPAVPIRPPPPLPPAPPPQHSIAPVVLGQVPPNAPPIFDFPAPMTREEFRKEQNYQLEQDRIQREKDGTYVPEKRRQFHDDRFRGQRECNRHFEDNRAPIRLNRSDNFHVSMNRANGRHGDRYIDEGRSRSSPSRYDDIGSDVEPILEPDKKRSREEGRSKSRERSRSRSHESRNSRRKKKRHHSSKSDDSDRLCLESGEERRSKDRRGSDKNKRNSRRHHEDSHSKDRDFDKYDSRSSRPDSEQDMSRSEGRDKREIYLREANDKRFHFDDSRHNSKKSRNEYN